MLLVRSCLKFATEGDAVAENRRKRVCDWLDASAIPSLERRIVASLVGLTQNMISTLPLPLQHTELRRLQALGRWIGGLTIGRNIPLPAKQFDLVRALRSEADQTEQAAVSFETGDLRVDGLCEPGRLWLWCCLVRELLAVVPRHSIFAAPNPWTLAVLGALLDAHYVLEGFPTPFDTKAQADELLDALGVAMADVPAVFRRRTAPRVHRWALRPEVRLTAESFGSGVQDDASAEAEQMHAAEIARPNSGEARWHPAPTCCR